MNKTKSIIVAALGFVGVSLSAPVLALPQTKFTQSCKPLVNKNLKVPQAPLRGLKERVQKRIVRGMEYLADSKYAEAIEIFKAIDEAAGDNHYVRSIANQNLAAAYSQQGKYAESLPYFQKALEYGEGNLPHERVQALRYNVAALLYQVGKTDESIKLLKDWLKKSNVEDDKVLILLSVIYAQRNQYKEAICPAYFAIKAAKKPKKDYYSVLMSAHYELGDMKGTAVILRELVEKFPQEANFWRQLSSLYLQLDRMEDSLIIQDLLYIQGKFEKENDYKSLSSLFAYAELPYQAAEILKEGMEKGVVEKTEANWRNVAQNYQAANEVDKAIEAWGKTAELSKDGKAYERQAQLYNEKDEWRKAISALNKALAKGNVDNPGLAYMNKGIAEINLKQCTQGIKTLKQASKYKSVRKQAVAWIGYAEQRVKQQKCK